MDFLAVLGATLVSLFFITLGWFFTAWWVMLMVSSIHNWWDFVPSMSYHASLSVVFFPFMFATALRSMSQMGSKD